MRRFILEQSDDEIYSSFPSLYGESIAYRPLKVHLHVSQGDIGYIFIPTVLPRFHATANITPY